MQTFEIYRFQLLPLSQHQHELFSVMYSADEIRENKNNFFESALSEPHLFDYRGAKFRHLVEYQLDEWFMLRLGIQKGIKRDTEDFQEERIESWPNVRVIINNNPDNQVIAISRNPRAFNSTRAVARIIERAVNRALRNYGLIIQIREQFEKKQFWSVIDEFRGKVTRVRFEMISPNMANISHVLKVDLKQLNRDSNCQRTNLELQAADGASLDVKENNELIEGCVEYSSLGGGDIAIKVRGYKKEIRTSSTVKTTEIDELHLDGPSDQIINTLNRLIQ